MYNDLSNRMKYFLFISILLGLFVGCFILRNDDIRTITGRLYVTGNEPFVRLAIEDPNQKIYLISRQSPVYKELWKHQGEYLKLTYVRSKIKNESMNDQGIWVTKFEIIKK